jgi:tetratricopeptide (TPR) repeat protein
VGLAKPFRTPLFATAAFGLYQLAAAGCNQQPVRLRVVASSTAETISLLGDTLYGLPLDPAGGPERIRRIQAAREAVQRDSSDLAAWLRLGRRTSEMGRLRDAMGVYTSAAGIHFTDPRIWRQRGEVLLKLRYLDAAIADLRKAGLLALNQPKFLEVVLGAGDSLAARDVTSLQYQVPMLLGFALYCKGNYPAAAEVLAEATKAALTPDEQARALLWLFFAVRRIGDGSGAARVLSLVRPELSESAQLPDITLLQGYQGTFPSDSIRKRALARIGPEGTLFSYGIAYVLLLKPEARADAELWLQRARSGADWTALPYLAAEADLARLRGNGRTIIK